MKKPMIFLLVSLIVLIPSACSAAPTPTAGTATGPAACPVTQSPSPAFIPPDPYPPKPPGDNFYYGASDLWTALPNDGVWEQLPQQSGGFTQKIVWWHAGYNPDEEPEPALTVTGRRIDAGAGPLQSDRATNAFAGDIGKAMMVGVIIPTTGCWQITGSYKGAELTFNIRVDK